MTAYIQRITWPRSQLQGSHPCQMIRAIIWNTSDAMEVKRDEASLLADVWCSCFTGMNTGY